MRGCFELQAMELEEVEYAGVLSTNDMSIKAKTIRYTRKKPEDSGETNLVKWQNRV